MSNKFRNKLQRKNKLFGFDIFYIKKSYLIKKDRLELLETFYVRKKKEYNIRL